MAINGAAARLINAGDIVIIGSFVGLDEREIEGFRPKKVFIDVANRIVRRPEGDEC